MIQVNINIANEGTGVLNTFPISWTCKSHGEWIGCLDEEDLCWTWEFKVSAKNISEFQPFIKLGRGELSGKEIQN